MSDSAKRLLESLTRDYEERDDFLDGVPEYKDGNPKRKVMEMMMEGTLNYLKRAIESNTTTSDFGTVDYQIFPLLRRTFPDEIAFDLVTVQPMTMPTGKVFWVNDLYGDANSGGSPDAITEDSRMDLYKDRTYADSTETASTVKRVSQSLTSVTVETFEKKLKGVWTVEQEQDARAYLGLSMDAEHSRIISQEFRRELGQLIIKQLVDGATAGNTNWNSSPPSGSTTVNIRAHAERIWEAIVDSMNLIFSKKYVMPNFIIGGTTSIGRLEKLEEYKLNRVNPEGSQYTVGRHFEGTIDILNTTLKVYKDPWFPYSNKLLLGYKGANWFEAGAFWAPYVPIWFTPTFYDPDTLDAKKGALTRNGRRSDTSSIVLDGNYYSTVTITSS